MKAHRRIVLAMVALAALGAAVAWRLRAPAAIRREPRLDVLLITIDTLRAGALHTYGNASASTPTIDALAEGGVRFLAAHSHNVETLPSHSNILSGRYPLDHGVRGNSGFRFPRETATLATLLKAQGYRTAAFVSAFPLSSRFGLDRGFDVYDDSFLSGEAALALDRQERHGPETIAAARAWWDAQGDAPKLLWVHLYEPHFPYEPPEPYRSRFPGEPYLGEVAAADAALAPLLQPIEQAGEGGRTLVVLTGDHGESLGEHGERTHGIFAYEGPLHIPLIAYCPRLFARGTVAQPVRHVDILPTVLDALGQAAPGGLSGRSLLPLLAGRQQATAPSYFEALSGMTNRRWAPLYGVIRDRWKYIDLPLPELYDLASDPREERNLVASRPQELEDMRTLLAGVRAGDQGVQATRESEDTRERLRALGYVSGSEGGPKTHYTADDDPKRLIALDALLQTVTARERAGDLAGARAVAEDIVRQNPQMALALVQLASLQGEQGDLAAAVATAQRAVALNPDDPESAALLGRFLDESDRAPEAVALLEPYARALDPYPDVLLAYGVALAQVGRGDEALAVLQKAAYGASAAMAFVDIGTVHLMARRPARAREAFEKALALNPRIPRAHNALGVIAAQAGDADAAIGWWTKALGVDPRDRDTLFNLGTMLVQRGRQDEGLAYLGRARAMKP
jgi:arylsulfatase A-like enzyme/tetratricopeptide (TPR) repeat protein